MLKRDQIFNREIFIATQRVRFYKDLSIDDQEYVIKILEGGYYLYIVKDSGATMIEKHEKLSLDKLNKLLPDDMQLSKDQVIYILTATKDE